MNKNYGQIRYFNELEAKSNKLKKENKELKKENLKLKKDLELAQIKCECLINYMDLDFNIQL